MSQIARGNWPRWLLERLRLRRRENLETVNKSINEKTRVIEECGFILLVLQERKIYTSQLSVVYPCFLIKVSTE